MISRHLARAMRCLLRSRLGPWRGRSGLPPKTNAVHLSVAQAVKPAEPRFISAFFAFPGDSSPSATTNESWIHCGVDFPRMGGRPAPVGHVASLREPATRALPAAKPTECGTSTRGGPLYLKPQPIAH